MLILCFFLGLITGVILLMARPILNKWITDMCRLIIPRYRSSSVPSGNIDQSFREIPDFVWIEVKDGSNVSRGDTFWKTMLHRVTEKLKPFQVGTVTLSGISMLEEQGAAALLGATTTIQSTIVPKSSSFDWSKTTSTLPSQNSIFQQESSDIDRVNLASIYVSSSVPTIKGAQDVALAAATPIRDMLPGITHFKLTYKSNIFGYQSANTATQI